MNNDSKSERVVRRPFILNLSEDRVKEVVAAYEKTDELLFKKPEKKKKKKKYF